VSRVSQRVTGVEGSARHATVASGPLPVKERVGHNIKGLKKLLPCSFAHNEYRRQTSNFLLTLVALLSDSLTFQSCRIGVVSIAVF
jgi:hypothetical protein